MDLTTHFVLSITSSTIIATEAVTLALVRIPKGKGWRRSNTARWILVASFLTLAVSGYFKIGDEQYKLMSIITICIAAFQALLFSYTATVFIAPSMVTARRMASQLAIITAYVCTAVTIAMLLPQYATAVRYAAITVYCMQLCYHTLHYRKVSAIAKTKLEAFYDEYVDSRLRPVNILFYSALAIGVLAVVFSVIPITNARYNVFVGGYTLYYMWVGAMVINYFMLGDFFVKAETRIVETEPCVSASTAAPGSTPNQSIPDGLDDALSQWVSERRYTISDISTDQVADDLGVTRQQLAAYFQSRHHTTFRSWRIKLRIGEAQRLLRENKGIKISSLHELVGFSDRSNFHNKFVEITGMTPKAYQQQARQAETAS